MKKIYYAMMTLLCAALATSCSKDSGKLLDAMPADVNVAVVVNVEAIVASSGGSVAADQIKLSKEMEDLLPTMGLRELDELNEGLKDSGIDLRNVAIAMSPKFNEVTLIAVTDEKKFKDWLEENDYDEEDDDEGITLYKKGYGSYWALCDGIAYYFSSYSDSKPMRIIKRFIEGAKEDPVSRLSVSNFMLDGNAFGMLIHLPKEALNELKQYGLPKEAKEFVQGYICFNGSLDGNQAIIKGKIYDAEGKSVDLTEFNNYSDLNAKVDSKALAFMSPDEMLVGAVAYKDVKWSKMMDNLGETMRLSSRDRAELSEVENYLKNLDGTVAIGLGVTNGLESIISMIYGYEVGKNLSATMVVEVREGAIQGVMNDLKDLVSKMGVSPEAINDGFMVSTPFTDVYCEAHDNFVVISNHKISKSNDNATVKNLDFGKYNAAMGIVADSKGQLMKSLNLNFDVMGEMWAKSADAEMGLTVKIDGGKANGIIAKAIELVTAVIDNKGEYSKVSEEVSEKVGASRSYNSYDSYDSYEDYEWLEDSAMVAEECVEVLEEDY